MLYYVLGGVAVVVILFLVVVASRPSEFRVARSTTIDTPPEAVFAHVNDFRAWDAWSPWSKIDPNSKATFEGPSAGTGAIFRWAGNNEVGEGSMEITESRPHEAIAIDLVFIKPFAGKSDVKFTFRPEGNRTVTTWSMNGKNNFMAKAVGLFMDCEKMISEKYDEGLANLKSVVETESAETATTSS
jgi:hypothetical protein